jgi:hypothetical protein
LTSEEYRAALVEPPHRCRVDMLATGKICPKLDMISGDDASEARDALVLAL